MEYIIALIAIIVNVSIIIFALYKNGTLQRCQNECSKKMEIIKTRKMERDKAAIATDLRVYAIIVVVLLLSLGLALLAPYIFAFLTGIFRIIRNGILYVYSRGM